MVVDFRRNVIWFVMLGVIVLAVAVYLHSILQIADKIEKQGKAIQENTEKVNAALERLNTSLDTIERLPAQIQSIQSNITELKEKSDRVSTDMEVFKDTEKDMQNSIKNLNESIHSLNTGIGTLNADVKQMEEFQKAYPPVQTQQLIFENVSAQEINQAIQNAITYNTRTYALTIGIGALFGSLLTFIYQNKKTDGN